MTEIDIDKATAELPKSDGTLTPDGQVSFEKANKNEKPKPYKSKSVFVCAAIMVCLQVGQVSAKAKHYVFSGYKVHTNCTPPKPDTFKFLKNGNLRIIQRHGDKGNCPTDPIPWKSKKWSKPYAERAEIVVEKRLYRGKKYHIRFDTLIHQGFLEDNRNETLFQIKGCATSDQVSLMVFLARTAWVPFRYHLAGDHLRAYSPVKLELKRWYRIDVHYQHGGKQTEMSMFIDGKPVVENARFRATKVCPKTGGIRLRLGLYRGGSTVRELRTTEVEYRNLKIDEMKSR